MRIWMLAAVLLAALPIAGAAGAKKQCKSLCSSQYQLCLNRATTKKARGVCKVEHRSCNGSCTGK